MYVLRLSRHSYNALQCNISHIQRYKRGMSSSVSSFIQRHWIENTSRSLTKEIPHPQIFDKRKTTPPDCWRKKDTSRSLTKERQHLQIVGERKTPPDLWQKKDNTSRLLAKERQHLQIFEERKTTPHRSLTKEVKHLQISCKRKTTPLDLWREKDNTPRSLTRERQLPQMFDQRRTIPRSLTRERQHLKMFGIHQGGFLSLIKYTAFVNALIVSLQESGLCCGVHSIPTCPPSYADDIATACLGKLRTDRVLDIVSNYGNKWRFNFNAKKSAVLIYGEGKRDHYRNSPDRVFCLGKDRVPERSNYDHVGVKSMIFNDDASQVSEKIAKARRALNATAGLGIRKNGLTMKTCNIIYWSVIIPILTFGSEIWHISATDYDALIDFQIYTGRRLQRFPARSPRSSSFYGLGWVRVTTFIMIKQMLFIMTILRLKEDNVIRRQEDVLCTLPRFCHEWYNC